MYILLMGPPGAGKGTQAAKLADRNHILHISTGDMFRAAVKAKTPFGLKAKQYMDAGELVPDNVTIGITQERLAKPDCAAGFILDGFPRTIEQAVALESIFSKIGFKLDLVINLVAPIDELVLRISGRRICKNCGATYHVVSQPATKEGQCDKCQGELFQRDDDRAETVKNRMTVYQKQIQALVEYYQAKGLYTEINGLQSIDQVLAGIVQELSLKTGI